MNVAGPSSSGGLTGLDARALRLLAETLIEGAARAPESTAPAASPPPSDRISVSVEALSAAPLQHLLQTIEQRLFPPSATLQDISAPAAADAKDAALKSVEKAAQSIEHAGIGVHSPHIPADLDPQTVLALATRMIETQQYPNYLRATELSNTIVTWYEGPIPDVPLSRPISIGAPAKIRPAANPHPRKWTQATARLWRRAPVLVLLGGWLLSGILGALLLIVAGVSRESSPLLTIWALGFPALIVLQFLLTIRGSWRRK